jgi:outer membrane murein-binding lipoprotein Lpp
VAVYATLEAGSDAILVNPVEVDPRCPKVIRTLLRCPGRWYHGFTELRGLQRVEGFEAGQGLAAEIKHPDRTVPFIVVTEVDQAAVALPELDRDLAYDLAGIANVVVLDSDATWALTDHLGARLSCYSGAVRLYWPRLSINENPYRHPLWTALRLRSTTGELDEIRQRFRRQLRSLVMSASALSVVRPREIDDIRSAASRRVFAELRERASSLQDHAELADLYEKDNNQLRAINADLMTQVDELQGQVAKLEVDRAALLAHLQAAKVLPAANVGADDIAPDATINGDQDLAEPVSGDVRFYKKKFPAPDHDVMVRVNDCGHNKWQSAHAADKARKGVAKVENGHTNWQTMQHCASCKGGGMWKVRW